MNPMKILGSSLPKLNEVLESVHARLEKANDQNDEIIDKLQQVINLLTKDEPKGVCTESPENNN